MKFDSLLHFYSVTVDKYVNLVFLLCKMENSSNFCLLHRFIVYIKYFLYQVFLLVLLLIVVAVIAAAAVIIVVEVLLILLWMRCI